MFSFGLPVMWFVVQTHQTHPSQTICILKVSCGSFFFFLKPNDIRFARQWLHLALLFVTVQPIFQSSVSKGRSENIRNKKTSVSLISSSVENYTCLFLLWKSTCAGFFDYLCTVTAECWTKLKEDRSLKLALLTDHNCHSHRCRNQWCKSTL